MAATSHRNPILEIRILGDFWLAVDGEPLAIGSLRQQSLIAYLLIHRAAPVPRRQIAFALWPESTDAQALTNLRRELHLVRKLLQEISPFLESPDGSIQWSQATIDTLDIAQFESLLAEADSARHNGQTVGAARFLQQAVETYGGPLLPVCYEEWILPERERLEQKYIRALENLVDTLSEQREYAAAVAFAQTLRRQDPLIEETYRRLMRLHALNGDRARALSIYHECSRVLDQELGVEPAPETQGIYRRLLRVDKAIPTHAEKTKLVGRQQEWQTLLTEYWRAVQGHPRMVLISGEAGLGKSRLAEELLHWVGLQGVLHAQARAYAGQDSLAFGPLVEILRAETIAETWSELSDVWLVELVNVLPEV